MTLDELSAFIQEARRSGASGNEDVGFAAHSWNDKLRRVKVDLGATPDRPASVLIDTPADMARALRRHFSADEVAELARLLPSGGSAVRMTPRTQSSTITRTRVVEYTAPEKRTLTLDDLAAFVQEARRMGARRHRIVDAEGQVFFGCALTRICVEAEPKPKRPTLPQAVRLGTPANTAAALRSGLRPGDAAELARLLSTPVPSPADSPPPADVAGLASDRALPEVRVMTTRKVRIQHETMLNLSLDDVSVFIRDARRAGARGDEIVRAATPPRYHGQTLWHLKVDVELPPVDRLVKAVRADRLAGAVQALRRALDPHDVQELAGLLTADDSDGDRGGDAPMTTRKIKIEHTAPKDGLLTLGAVAEFVRDAAQAGAHGDEYVKDPSRAAALSSLCVEIEAAAADSLMRELPVDGPANTARLLRRALDPHDVRELARLLTAQAPRT